MLGQNAACLAWETRSYRFLLRMPHALRARLEVSLEGDQGARQAGARTARSHTKQGREMTRRRKQGLAALAVALLVAAAIVAAVVRLGSSKAEERGRRGRRPDRARRAPR